jgi:hypothetical protein
MLAAVRSAVYSAVLGHTIVPTLVVSDVPRAHLRVTGAPELQAEDYQRVRIRVHPPRAQPSMLHSNANGALRSDALVRLNDEHCAR